MYTDRRRMVPAIILAYLTVLGTAVNLQISESNEYLIIQLIKAFKGFSLTQLFLFAGLCALYTFAFQCIKSVDWTLREKILVLIPAALFAGFMVVGYSFAQTNSWDLILKDFLQKIKAVFAFAGYGIAFTILIAWFYTWLHDINLVGTGEQLQKGRGLLGWYKNFLVVEPFRTTFLTLLIVYIPYAILSYPAIFMGDSKNIIAQGFNLPEGTSNYLNLIDENVRLNGHHPIVYTEFIHICLVVGKTVFNSYNVGIFLVSLTQLLGVCAVVAMSVRLLAQLGIRENILLVLIVYFSLAPRIQNYMFLNAKDVLAACAMLVFLLSAFKIVWNKACRGGLILSGIAMGLLRNDGKYVILGSIVIMLIVLKVKRKLLLCWGVVIAITLGLFFNALMPTLHITPASRREALSVPFQQTARYFRDYESEVTEEEYSAVAAVLKPELLKEKYDPNLSDAVKATFLETATKEDLWAYFKVWFQMGLKHPGAYIQATLNNYYIYFYPGKMLAQKYSYNWSESCMAVANEALQEIGCSFHYPEIFDGVRTTYEVVRESVFEIPLLSLLKCPAAYVWALILLAFYFIKEKAWKALALLAPLVLSVGICFLGPCNGEYFRYLYGVSVCLPVMAILTLWLCGNANKYQ